MITPETTPTRRPMNEAEGAFYDAATAAGWTPIKRGWPDFFMWNEDGRYAAVEVKPNARHPLTRHQLRIARVLREHGIPTFRWDPESGFREVAT